MGKEEEEEEEEEILGNNSIEDVSWLCSLSESELNLLIILKTVAMKRASEFGHVQLANQFDLKMLRAIGLILMEYLEEKVKDLSVITGLIDSGAFLDCSDLLKGKLDDVMSIEEIKEHITFKTRKDFCKRPREKSEKNATDSSKRPRSEDPNEETRSDLVNIEETTSCHD